ncbi:rhodanese-like domain-containing protein [Undibacterium parvum]|uniref:Rhodanese-like domain-containing protein n=2 Tax=Undibacterium TaxID=401469 RepID=A0A6M4A1W7_9BURK|nr:rhodanese-like domain-containing protein [Undibacterium parvum]AZP10673.1 rhodanese-like domain-containing protein [Undibacterium parvum]QJQ05291.1 rhodanese-like domain-containing protein [Undibacterium piscinae]
MSLITEIAAAASPRALAHFEAMLEFETDCWDVNDAISSGTQDFVLFDVRSAEKFAQGHVPGAVHLPRGKMIASKLAKYSADTLFVTYCAGPHCNGAARAAIVLARQGRPVKTMPGGITGWIDEGFALDGTDIFQAVLA